MATDERLICRREQLVDGGLATRFCLEFDGTTRTAFAIAFDGAVHAYLNSCPHRGTQLDWQEGQVFDESGLYLVCATHGALFEADSGRCVGGPCTGTSLARVQIEEIGNGVFLQVGRLISTSSRTPSGNLDDQRGVSSVAPKP